MSLFSKKDLSLLCPGADTQAAGIGAYEAGIGVYEVGIGIYKAGM